MRRIFFIILFTVFVLSGCASRIDKLIEKGEYGEAAELLQQQIALHPEDFDSAVKLMILYNDHLDDFRTGAYTAYNYINKGFTENGISGIAKLLFRNYADELILAGEKPDSALFFSKMALILDSNYASACLIAGKAYVKLSIPDSGAAYLERAVQLDSTLLDAYVYLGNMALLDDSIRKGEQYYMQALRIDSTFANAWTNLGILYYNTKNYSESMTCFKKAVHLKPADIVPYDYIISMFTAADLNDSAFAYMKKYERATGKSLKVEL